MATQLPQLRGDRLYITDGGLETVLIFQRGIDLPEFASFTLLEDDEEAQALRDYFRPYAAIARDHGAGLVVDTATWRANPDWGERLGYSRERLRAVNRRAVELAREVGAANPDVPTVVNGVIGPRRWRRGSRSRSRSRSRPTAGCRPARSSATRSRPWMRRPAARWPTS